MLVEAEADRLQAEAHRVTTELAETQRKHDINMQTLWSHMRRHERVVEREISR